MRKALLTLTFYILVSPIYSQELFVQAGRTSTSFDFKTSAGSTLDNLSGSMQTSLGLGTRFALFKTNVNLLAEMVYQEYGARGADIALGNYFDWSFTNIGGNIGLGYEFFKPKVSYNEQSGFSVFVYALFGSEFLVQGTQTINQRVYKLKGVEEFDKPFYFYKGGVCFNYYITKKYQAFIRYTGGKSFLVGNYTNLEQLKLNGHNVSIGFSVRIIQE
jgi:hypothetical protein